MKADKPLKKAHRARAITGPGIQRCLKCGAKLRTITAEQWANGSRGWTTGPFVVSDGRGNMLSQMCYDPKIVRPCGRSQK